MNSRMLIVGLSLCLVAVGVTWGGYTLTREGRNAEMRRLLFGGSEPTGIEELDASVEKPPIDRAEARKIASMLISFPLEPEARLMSNRHGYLWWEILSPPTAYVRIDARTGDVFGVLDQDGFGFARGLSGRKEDVAEQVIEKLGLPNPSFMDLVCPRKESVGSGDRIWWSLEVEGIPVDGLIGVAFNDDGQPSWAGQTWIVMDDSGSEAVLSEEEAASIGRETAIGFGWAHNNSGSESELIWQRPIDVETFGYKYRLTWATIHSNPSPRPKGVPSKAYVYVDALTGEVTGIDCTDG